MLVPDVRQAQASAESLHNPHRKLQNIGDGTPNQWWMASEGLVGSFSGIFSTR